MQIAPPTDRLYFREILPSDDKSFFELDSDPEVHKKSGMKHIENFMFEGIEAAWYEMKNPNA